MKFPVHEAGLQLFHNDHKTNYQSAADWIVEFGDDYDWASEDAKRRAIKTDSIWTMIWFPKTPVGSLSIAAPTLEELLKLAESYDDGKRSSR